MAITSRQFNQLSEMGISLWQSRARQNAAQTKQDDYLPQNQESLTELSKQKLFSDILLSLNLTLGEVKAQDNHLDVGLFNWYFLTKEIKEKATQADAPKQNSLIHCVDNKLVSPSIETIAQSANLKKQLWHIIAKHLL